MNLINEPLYLGCFFEKPGVSIKFEVGSWLEQNNWLHEQGAVRPLNLGGSGGRPPPENFEIWKLWNAIISSRLWTPNWVQKIKEDLLSTATFFLFLKH